VRKDESSTPYFRAFLEEVSRLIPMTNFLLFHSNGADDNIKGWHFPKGTQVFE